MILLFILGMTMLIVALAAAVDVTTNHAYEPVRVRSQRHIGRHRYVH